MVACAPDFCVRQKLDPNDSWDGDVGFWLGQPASSAYVVTSAEREQTDLNVHDNVGRMVVRLHLFPGNGRFSCRYGWDENGVLLGFHLLRFGMFYAFIYQKPAR